MAPGVELITFERKGNDIEVFLKDSTDQLNGLFLRHESFISTLPKSPRRADGFFPHYVSLYEVQNSVFSTIANWIINRIPAEETSLHLPNKRWVHDVIGETFTSVCMRDIHFEDISFVGGPNGRELLIRCIAYINGLKREGELLFPIFDPQSWDNLNATQCAILTYALCLFHEICLENNYELVYSPTETFRKEIIDYKLFAKNSLLERTPMVAKKERTEGKEGTKEETEEKSGKKHEHWVSFHFRRLLPNHQASDEARRKAAIYGFKELPSGFTFVDSFVRGEKIDTIGMDSQLWMFYSKHLVN